MATRNAQPRNITHYREASRARVLQFLAGLAHAARDTRAAEGYLLELLAVVMYAPEPIK